MATYVNNLRLKEITTGDEDGTWGTSTNTNLELITDGFSYGTKAMAADADETFTMPDATADATRSLYLKFTSGVSLTATRVITLGPNTISKTWIIENATTGGQIITIKQGSGATVDIPNGDKTMVVTDGAGAGAAVLNANPSTAEVDLTTDVTGTLPIANGGTNATTAAGARASLSANALPILKGTSYTAVVGEFIVASAGGITITLPATPSAGDTVTVKDGTGDAATTTFTVGRNGSNIAASATDLIFDKNYAEITMTYIDGTIGWSV
jgi:hypothetical protein